LKGKQEKSRVTGENGRGFTLKKIIMWIKKLFQKKLDYEQVLSEVDAEINELKLNLNSPKSHTFRNVLILFCFFLFFNLDFIWFLVTSAVGFLLGFRIKRRWFISLTQGYQ
jgi:hypothetical protein